MQSFVRPFVHAGVSVLHPALTRVVRDCAGFRKGTGDAHCLINGRFLFPRQRVGRARVPDLAMKAQHQAAAKLRKRAAGAWA